MAVKEQEAVAATAPEGQETSEQDGAIPAEYEREPIAIQDGPNRIRQSRRVLGDALWVQEERFRITPGIMGRRLDTTSAACSHTACQTCADQRVGQQFDATRGQAKGRRSLDDLNHCL